MSFQCHQRGACHARAVCDTVFATNPTTATPTREIGSRTTSLIHKTLSAQPPVSKSPTSWRRASSRSGSLTRTRRRHPQRDWSSSCPARRRWLRTGRGGQTPSPTKPSTSSGARHSSGQPARPRLNQARPCHSSAEDDAQKVECAPRALFHTTEMITRRSASSRPTRTASPHRSTPHVRKAAPDRRHPRPWSGAATTTPKHGRPGPALLLFPTRPGTRPRAQNTDDEAPDGWYPYPGRRATGGGSYRLASTRAAQAQ